MDNILHRVQRACAAADRIPDINRGGCCVFAAELGEALQRQGVPCWGVACEDPWDEGSNTPGDVRRFVRNPLDINEWNDHGVYLHHVMLRFRVGNQYYQCDTQNVTHITGTVWLAGREFDVKRGRFTVGELLSFSQDRDAWSSRFHYKRGVDKIRTILHNVFSSSSQEHSK